MRQNFNSNSSSSGRGHRNTTARHAAVHRLQLAGHDAQGHIGTKAGGQHQLGLVRHWHATAYQHMGMAFVVLDGERVLGIWPVIRLWDDRNEVPACIRVQGVM